MSSTTPQKLRSGAIGDWIAVPGADGPMLADAMEIADSCARADIESECRAEGEGGDFRNWWWNIESADPESRGMVDKSLRYLDARGLVECRTENGKRLVRFRVVEVSA